MSFLEKAKELWSMNKAVQDFRKELEALRFTSESKDNQTSVSINGLGYVTDLRISNSTTNHQAKVVKDLTNKSIDKLKSWEVKNAQKISEILSLKK